MSSVFQDFNVFKNDKDIDDIVNESFDQVK